MRVQQLCASNQGQRAIRVCISYHSTGMALPLLRPLQTSAELPEPRPQPGTPAESGGCAAGSEPGPPSTVLREEATAAESGLNKQPRTQEAGVTK